ncbi:amidohydrolase family protein [Actinoplanes sp. TFC3]|uniref:amidohydrolase family protein n=1 Tax=Actinoplanes sp. TFC3 TaxID=1710355 RepID=UPI0008301DBE|nr:amidohydrolase family protein [Actinoplanes sp. TFC3]
MSLIAIEEHWTTPALTAALNGLPDSDDSLAFNEMGDKLDRLQDLGEGRLATLDEQGIDTSVIALTPPGTQPLAPADAVSLSRELNDTAAEAVRRHPTRFRALATLPLSEPSAVAGELERAAGMGFVGAMVYGRTGDVALDDSRYDDLFATAAALGQPIFIHPQIPSRAIRDAAYGGFDEMTSLALATFGWGWHIEAGLAALRLIVRGTFDRHPDLQIILGHWGELLPFWSDRTNSLSRIAGLSRPVAEYLRSNFYLTTSGMLNPVLLQHALAVTTIDRLIFSTDYPFQQPTGAEIRTFLEAFGSDVDRAKFTSGNARTLFKL